MKVLLAQKCQTLCDPMDCSLPGSSVPVIPQARILQWVAISFSRGSSWPRDRTRISCTGRWILYHWASWEAHAFMVTELIFDPEFPEGQGKGETWLLIYSSVFSTWGESRPVPLEIHHSCRPCLTDDLTGGPRRHLEGLSWLPPHPMWQVCSGHSRRGSEASQSQVASYWPPVTPGSHPSD